MDSRESVVIIGGGVAGLACAVALCQDFRVTLLEAGAELGGRARSWRDEATGDMVDIGPHILLTEYHNFLGFLRDLGTADQVVWEKSKFITLVSEPRPVTIHMHQLVPPLHFAPSLLKAPQASLAELASNRHLMWKILRLTDEQSRALDTVTAEDYLRQQGVDTNFIDWFWRSACMSIMNVPLERCSAGALLRFFRFMMGKSGYRVGFAGTSLGELFADHAVSRIRAQGGEVRLNTRVQTIADSGKSSEGPVQQVRLQDGSQLETTVCVAAIPPQNLHKLVPETWRARVEGLQQLEQIKPSPYISVYLWFDRKLSRDSFWANVWSPDTLNYDFYDLSNIRPEWHERPSVIASNIIYSHRAVGLDDAEIIEKTVEELRHYLPEAELSQVIHSRVHRIPMAIPAPYPGSEALRPANSTSISGFYLAGDWTDTGLPASMESATRSGYLAAEAVFASRGQSRSIAAPPPAAEGLVRLVGGR